MKSKNRRMRWHRSYLGQEYTVTGYTERELRKKEKEKQLLIDRGIEIKKGVLSVDEYYTTYFEKNRRDLKTVKAATIYTDRSNWDARISPIIGRKKLADVKTQDIERLIAAELAAGHKSTTVNNTLALLRKVFKRACERDRFIPFDPTVGLIPVPQQEAPAKEKIHRSLTADEITRLNAQLSRSRWYPAIRFTELTGCRIGETLGLTWGDVDFALKEVAITKTVSRISHREYELSMRPKTSSSRRKIPLADESVELLSEYRKTAVDQTGQLPQSDDVIFKTERGTLGKESAINKIIAEAAKKAGIEHFSSHAFRATFASEMVSEGVDDVTLTALLGHSSINVTRKYYVSDASLRAPKREAIEKREKRNEKAESKTAIIPFRKRA